MPSVCYWRLLRWLEVKRALCCFQHGCICCSVALKAYMPAAMNNVAAHIQTVRLNLEIFF